MPIDDYYMAFYKQEWVGFPDGFGGMEHKWADGDEIKGLFIQDSSGDQRRAEAVGTSSGGVFVAPVSADVKEGDIVKRGQDGFLIRITGTPINAPGPAVSKMKKMNAQRTEMPI